MDGINAYIVVAPSFTEYSVNFVKKIVNVARENQTQVIFPLDTFEVSYERKGRTTYAEARHSQDGKFDVLVKKLKELFPDSGGELPQGQPVVRLQKKHEGVYDNGVIRPLLDTIEGYSLAFLMYARKTFGKKLIFVSKFQYEGSCFKSSENQRLNAFALYGFARYEIELCNDSKLCNPFYIRDLITGKPRQYTVIWPPLINDDDKRLDETLMELVYFLIMDNPDLDYGVSTLIDHKSLCARLSHKVWMFEHREKFETMLGKSLFDEYTRPGPTPLSMHGKVLSILCGNDERYQDLIEYCEQPSEYDSD